ncbi:MAG: hypothetical protein IKK21_07980 [Clostridia bacterium]|nr:hypothetical protein [Clostridia bacterium]
MRKPTSGHTEQAREMQEIAHKLLQLLLHNWGFKLVALISAIVLWAGLISRDPTLTREKVFSDVTIGITGADTMKRNGFIVVSNLDEIRSDAFMRVEVPQMQYDNATVTTYNPRVDLSRIKETGKQTLRVTTTSTSTYGTVTEISPATLEIEVEEYITRYRIPVMVYTTGQPPEGYYATSPSVDPPVVAISGPRSLVEKIVRAEAVMDQSTLPAREGIALMAIPFRLIDTQGNAVESSLIEVTSESVLLDAVVIEQTLYPTRTLALSNVGLLTGEPAEGYEIKTVTITPDIVTAAGPADSLNLLDALFPDSQVDVGEMTESFTQQIRVRRPSELNYLSATSVTVAVEIGPTVVSRTFSDVKIEMKNIPSGYTASIGHKTVTVTVTGPQLWVDSLRSAHITARCNLDGLEEGIHEVPVNVLISTDEGQSYTLESAPAMVMAEIKAK